MEPKQHPSEGHGVTNVAEWFVAIAGLIYGTGFLVLLTFYDYIGVREATTDFLRAKFLHVGIICLALPVLATGAAYGIVVLRTPGSMPVGRKLYGSSVVLTFNLLFTFVMFLMFAPQGYMKDRPYLILTIFAVTLLGLIGIEALAKVIKKEHAQNFRTVTRWILCGIVILGLDYYCFHDMYVRLEEVFWPRGIGFVLFVTSIAFVVYRVKLRTVLYREPSAKLALWILTVCILGPVYFLTVLSFAYAIYPNIPASRGGGDFTDAPTVLFYYKNEGTNRVPAEINRGGISQPLVLVEEAEHWLIAADPLDAGGPAAWRRGTARPQIYSVNREDVVSVVYQSRRLPPPAQGKGNP